jgi:hypothetical protein
MSALFSKPRMPDQPPVPTPAPMVDEDLIRKKKRDLTTQRSQRGGRESTILGGLETLGGG